MTLLSIDDFHFKGTRERFGNGEYLVTLDGWEDGVSMRRSSQPIPQNHGDFDVPTFMEGRTVNFTADAYARNPMELAHRGHGFTALLAQGTSRMVTIELDGQTLWGMARRGNAAPRWRRAPGGVDLARASMELFFPNPRKFGESRVFTGAAPVAFHYGNFPATPVFTVTGSAPAGYTINLSAGKQYTVTVPLASGVPHVIDMADGYLRINGLIVSNSVGRADLLAIPGGASVAVSVTPVSGTASLSVLLLDTFM
ncbi:hypothetical protein [Cryobacterium sp. Y11]|uniref:hypothetical protein n=1 Tax=Cryobacterium sp. Y11 TaxID=2045016 RepID=UPI000CE3352D|nr:hypothetical protein [Cryobacterium sp. Y11]